MLGEASRGVCDSPRGEPGPLDICKGTGHQITPKSGGTSSFPCGPLPFLRGLLYHRSFWMSGMVILAVGLSVRILCSSAGGDEGVEHNMGCVWICVYLCVYICVYTYVHI